MATKAIKFKDSSNVYLPVTNSKLVQYGDTSVKEVLDILVTNENNLLNDIQNTAGKLVVSNSASSTSNTATVSTNPYVNLISYDGNTVLSSLGLEGSGLTVSYANNKLTFKTAAANNGELIVSDGTTSRLTIFSADERNNKTFNVVGGSQITSAVSTVNDVPTVTISHAAITTTVGDRPTMADAADEHHFDLSYVKEIATADNGHVSSYELGIIRFGEGANAVHGSIVEGNMGYVTGGDVHTAVHTAIEDVAKALKYQGIINESTFPSNPSKGDTYFFGSAQNIDGKDYEKGDMAIFDGENWGVVNANWTAVDGSSQLTVGGSLVTLATIGGVTIDAQINGLSITDKNQTTTVAGTISSDRKFTALTAVEAEVGGFTYVNTEYTLPADVNTAAIWTDTNGAGANTTQLKVGIDKNDTNASTVKIAGSGSLTVTTDTANDIVTLFAPVVTSSEDLKYDTFTLENLEDFTLPLTADDTDKPIVTAVSVSSNS